MLYLANVIVRGADLAGEAQARIQVHSKAEVLDEEAAVVRFHLVELVHLHPQCVGIHTYRIGETLPYTDLCIDILHLHAPKS